MRFGKHRPVWKHSVMGQKCEPARSGLRKVDARGTCPTAVGARRRLISLRKLAEAVPCLSWHLSQITQGSSNPRQGRRLRHLDDVVGVASKRL